MIRTSLLLGCLWPLMIPAQDLIVTADAHELIAQVVAIDETHLHYRPFDEPEASPTLLPKQAIQYVIYADGMRQYFSIAASKEGEPARVITPTEMHAHYAEGVADARSHYDNKAALWGTFGATIIFPFAGITTGGLTGVVIASIPPQIKLDALPDPTRYQRDPAYAAGYQEQAGRRKFGRVLTGYGLGVAVQATFIGAIAALLN